MWLCSTRLDLIAEVGVLQAAVSTAKVKAATGLHFRYFPRGSPLRLQCIHDASSPSKGKAYAQQGIMVLLMPELPTEILYQDEIECDDGAARSLCNYGHLLYAHGGKAKRVSYSTSHAEPCQSWRLEASSVFSTRLTELWLPDAQPNLRDLTEHQESGSQMFPVDTATDCRDFFELSTGSKSVPQDKLQRLYILAFKEARVTGRLRYFMLVPTLSMLADALTKPMTSPQMMAFLSTGFIEIQNEEKHSILLRRLPLLYDLKEEDLDKPDDVIKKEVLDGKRKAITACMIGFVWKKPLVGMFLAMSTLPMANAREDDNPASDENVSEWNVMFLLMIFGGYVLLRMIEKFLSGMMSRFTAVDDENSKRKKKDTTVQTTDDNGHRNRHLLLDEPSSSSSSDMPPMSGRTDTERGLRERIRAPREVWIHPNRRVLPHCKELYRPEKCTCSGSQEIVSSVRQIPKQQWSLKF